MQVIGFGSTQAAAARGPGAARADRAYDHLLMELLEGGLEAGDWLSVVDVATRLGCSRVPVMEAVKRLAAEGFLTVLPQVGCRVAIPDPAEVGDFFTLFAAVEGCVARIAAARRTEDEIARFEALCADIDRRLRGAGPPEARDPLYRRLNLQFHTAIHGMAKAPGACRVAAGMWDRSDFYIKLAFGSLYFSRRVRQAHLAIRRALVAGDADGAETAVEQHLRAVGSAVVQRLRERFAEATSPASGAPATRARRPGAGPAAGRTRR